MVRVHLKKFFIIKICNFITMRFNSSFQKFCIVVRLAIEFFFLFFYIYYIFISYHLQSEYRFIYIFHHKFSHKNLFQEALQVMTKYLFIVFFTKKKSYERQILSQYVRPLEGQDFYSCKFFFQSQYPQTLNFLYPFLYETKNVYVI